MTCAFSTMVVSEFQLLITISTSSPAFATAPVWTNRPLLDRSTTNPENVLRLRVSLQGIRFL